MPAPVPPPPPGVLAEVVVDLGAVRRNVAHLRRAVGDDVALMVVVKADGYGHGAVPVARAARAAGAPWLGVATVPEALALRASGDDGPLLAWMQAPGEDLVPAVAAGVDLASYSVGELGAVVAAGARAGRTPRVHLKVDTGLSRGGASPADWPALCAAARAAEERGEVEVVGVWSHLAAADEPDHPANDAQERAFRDALDVAAAAGLRPRWRHLANSAGALLRRSARFDLVRCGLASYGLDPAPGTGAGVGLEPAMTVQARLLLAREVEAGAGVSYGHRWVAPAPTRLGLVPAGYAEGVPRAASDRAEVSVAGTDGWRRAPLRGRVCMDQFVVELGAASAAGAGDVVELWGTGHDGAPTAQEWAEACGTISYEVVTRVGGRLSRRWIGEEG